MKKNVKEDNEISEILKGELLNEEYLDNCEGCNQLPLLRRIARTLLKVLENQKEMKKMIEEHNNRLKDGQTRFDKIKEFQIEKNVENGTLKKRVNQLEDIMEKMSEWKGETNKILGRLSIAFIALGLMGTIIISIVGYIFVLHLR